MMASVVWTTLRQWVAPAILAATVIVSSAIYMGSFGELTAWVRGEALSVEPLECVLGQQTNRTPAQFELWIRNHTAHEITIVGGKTLCSCISLPTIPLSIPPQSRRSLRVEIDASRVRGGQTSQTIRLFTDDSQLPEIQSSIFVKERSL